MKQGVREPCFSRTVAIYPGWYTFAMASMFSVLFGVLMAVGWWYDRTGGSLIAPAILGGLVIAVAQFVKMSHYKDMPGMYGHLRGNASGFLTGTALSLVILAFTALPGSIRLYAALLSGGKPSAESGTGEQQASHLSEASALAADIAYKAKEPFDFTMTEMKALTEDQKGHVSAARNLLRTNMGQLDAAIAHDHDAAKAIRSITAPAEFDSIEKLQLSECIKEVGEQLELRSQVNSILKNYANTGDRRLYNGFLEASADLSKAEIQTQMHACKFCRNGTDVPCLP